MNGDFTRLYGDSSHGSGIKFEGRWESCQIGFVASFLNFISGYAIATSKSPGEESLPFSAVRRRSLRCYNRSKFGLLQRPVLRLMFLTSCYNRSKFGLLQPYCFVRTRREVVITVQNSVFYNVAHRIALCFTVVITVQNLVFYNASNLSSTTLAVVITVQNSVFYNL